MRCIIQDILEDLSGISGKWLLVRVHQKASNDRDLPHGTEAVEERFFFPSLTLASCLRPSEER